MTTHRQILIVFLLLPILTFAEGQWGFDYFEWTIDFILVFALWFAVTKAILIAIKKYRKQDLAKKYKYIVWTIIGFIAFFHWSMTTYDPHPTEGPIDSLFWRERVTDKKLADSVETYKQFENEIAKRELEQFQQQQRLDSIGKK